MTIDKLVNDVRDLVQVNAHTEAYLLIADHFCMERAKSEFSRILRNQNRAGFLTMGDNEDRYRVYKNMFKTLFENHRFIFEEVERVYSVT